MQNLPQTNETHEMVLQVTDEGGVELWHCPHCGRLMRVNWNPEFRREVIAPGDDYAIHVGSKGDGFALVPAQVQPGRPDAEIHADDGSLSAWREWLDDANINF